MGFQRLVSALELEAHTTPKSAEGRHESHMAVLGVKAKVALGQEIVALGVCLPAARTKLRQALMHADVKIGLHIEKSLAKAVNSCETRTVDPIVAGYHPSPEASHSSRNPYARGVPSRGVEQLAKRQIRGA